MSLILLYYIVGMCDFKCKFNTDSKNINFFALILGCMYLYLTEIKLYFLNMNNIWLKIMSFTVSTSLDLTV